MSTEEHYDAFMVSRDVGATLLRFIGTTPHVRAFFVLCTARGVFLER